jgi:hypothetical protein
LFCRIIKKREEHQKNVQIHTIPETVPTLVKPSFQKILVHSGAVVKLSISNDEVLLPMSQSRVKSKKGLDLQNGVMIS